MLLQIAIGGEETAKRLHKYSLAQNESNVKHNISAEISTLPWVERLPV